MFDELDTAKKRDLPGYTVVSVGMHALIVGALLTIAGLKVREARKKEVDVAFIGPGKT